MSSMAGVTGTPNLVPYCATKCVLPALHPTALHWPPTAPPCTPRFALRGMMDALFLELRAGRPDSAVRLTTIHPFTGMHCTALHCTALHCTALTTTHPFPVDTGLAKRPRSRCTHLLLHCVQCAHSVQCAQCAMCTLCNVHTVQCAHCALCVMHTLLHTPLHTLHHAHTHHCTH
jgi:hypothetical protein